MSRTRIALAIVIAAIALFPQTATAKGQKPPAIQAEAVLSVSAPGPKVSAGDVVSITANVSGVSGLYGADVRVKADGWALVGVDAGGVFGCDSWGFASMSKGVIMAARTLLNPCDAFNGSGTLFVFNLRALADAPPAPVIVFAQLADRDGYPVAALIK